MTAARHNATRVVRQALAGTGVEIVASCSIGAYDEAAPAAYRSSRWLSDARGLVVAGSAGPELWRAFSATRARACALESPEHPYDEFVASRLDRADAALAASAIRFRRFEAAFQAEVRLDFLALARLVGLGTPGPFGLAIHAKYGAWWALRGAWMVDAEVDPPLDLRQPCVGCSAPCVGGSERALRTRDGFDFVGDIAEATADVRSRCVIGQAARYDPDQIAYHYRLAAPLSTQKRGS